ncbi:MAG: 50S ribosomal protein L10 [Chloroflexota bacterium]
MPTAKKADTVADIQDLIQRATIAISTDYRGMRVADLTALRRKLRENGVEYHIIKNTLGRLAAQNAEKAAYLEVLSGPTALAFGFGDQVEAAKSLTDYLRASRLNLPVRGAVLDGRVVDTAGVQALAALPSKNILLAQVLGGIQTPLVGLVSVLNGVTSAFVRVLDARAKQLAG